jgi:hypothetical protein
MLWLGGLGRDSGILQNIRSATPARGVRYHKSGRGGSNCAGGPERPFRVASRPPNRVPTYDLYH